MSDADAPILREQIAYYRARAGEYDEWFLRQGRYDHGPEANARWFAEVEQVAAALDHFAATGHVLELAAGTGLWSQRLLHTARKLTVLDASPEVLAIHRERVDSDLVEYLVADLFSWQPPQQYDVVFFSFWLSHVPPERLEGFWQMVRGALRPGGRVFVVDSQYQPESTARDHILGSEDETIRTRRLNDGRTFRIVKVFHQPETLTRRLAELGWSADVHATAQHFVYGSAEPAHAGISLE